MITTDPNHPDLKRGIDADPVPQNKAYLVLSEEERSKGFIRKVRDSYVHKACGVLTKMNITIAETYARDPKFYGATYCIGCKKHLPVDEFVWHGTNELVGS